MGWLSTEVDFSRCGATQTLMRSQVAIVVKPLFKPAFEIRSHLGFEIAQSQGVFESSPKPFDNRDGAVPADGTEALACAEPSQRFAKPLGGELPSLVGDEVPGWAEAKRGPLNQPAHLSGTGFFPEHLGCERHAGEDIEYDHELEGEQAKEAGDGRDVGHPDVIRVARAEITARRVGSFGNRDLGRFFFDEATDGAFADLPAGPTESLSDLLGATEAGRVHGMDEMADDIGIAPDGRIGTNE